MNTASESRSGMTRPELLLVVGVTMILAAVLFPSLAGVREFGRRSNCQGNLQQIGLGLAQYTNDYDKHIVPNGYDNVLALDLLQPYIKDDRTQVCPSDPAPRTAYTGRKYSYVLNNLYYRDGKIGKLFEVPAASVASIRDMAGTVMMCDGNTGDQVVLQGGVAGADMVLTTAITPAELYGLAPGQGHIVARHLGGANNLFADGHVKCLTLADLAKRTGGMQGNYSYFTKTLD